MEVGIEGRSHIENPFELEAEPFFHPIITVNPNSFHFVDESEGFDNVDSIKLRRPYLGDYDLVVSYSGFIPCIGRLAVDGGKGGG